MGEQTKTLSHEMQTLKTGVDPPVDCDQNQLLEHHLKNLSASIVLPASCQKRSRELYFEDKIRITRTTLIRQHINIPSISRREWHLVNPARDVGDTHLTQLTSPTPNFPLSTHQELCRQLRTDKKANDLTLAGVPPTLILARNAQS